MIMCIQHGCCSGAEKEDKVFVLLEEITKQVTAKYQIFK